MKTARKTARPKSAAMTPRERFVACLRHEPVDRIPFMPGHGRRSTNQRWRAEGLPADVTDIVAYVRKLLDMPEECTRTDVGPAVGPGVVLTMIPEFDEIVIEERPNSRVVQDWKGNICEIGKEFGPSDLRGAPDFCTRSWLKCPVESPKDWADMVQRYDKDDSRRFPLDFESRIQRHRQSGWPVGLVFPGPFWQLREWLGFENLCMLLLDDPKFADQMITFWREFIAAMLERMFRGGKGFIPDYVMINEDMAYKEKPMIGPDQARRFLLPTWQCWAEVCRNAGVPVYGVDSDGYVGSLIPVWIDGGFVWNGPQEVAAGNDLPAYVRQFGSAMSYSGGVDKRCIAAGGDVIRREFDRLRPAVAAGGFIPGCDHGIPHDVSWENFLDYCRLLAELTGWR